MDIYHETLVFERDFNAPPARLFQAYADPREREIWSAPSPDTVFEIQETDVRAGGTETARCGPPGDLKWTIKVTYHSVTEERMISFTEELWEGDMLLTVALTTFDLTENGKSGTRLKLTDQITSFVGVEAVDGHREGYTHALAHLAGRLVPV